MLITWSKIAYIVTAALFLLNSCSTEEEKEDLSVYVNPFIGTGGHGHTYPGVSMPFGMVQLSPDTRLEGWDGCSGYHYSDSIIYGFSHTHLSGTGCSDYGDILIMPTTGKVQMFNGSPENPASGYCSAFLHENETAKAGYYSVVLSDYSIKTELTATKRVGIHRYTYPPSPAVNVIIDLLHRDNVLDSYLCFTGSNEITGYRRSQAWAQDQIVYFVIQFSEPFISSGIVCDETEITNKNEAAGKNIKAFVNFNTAKDTCIIVKTALSGVSVEGARKNLNAEASHWDFDSYVTCAADSWNNVLNKVQVKAPEEKKTIFYTALYHSYLCPNIWSDVDGSYRGMDNKIHNTGGFDFYTVFSLWDTYRALHPLMTILEPQVTCDFIKTFIYHYNQSGKLPVWELAANETNCMIGYHSVSVIYDAWSKGLASFDAVRAFEAMKASAFADNPGLASYRSNGFIDMKDEGESVSKTLEYAYDDWCIALMAKSLKREEDYQEFIQRAQYYKNLYDDSTRFMRARINGTWFTPFSPEHINFNYTEANAWQYSFYVPHDINGLIGLHGGDENFVSRLDEMFGADSRTTGRVQADITGLLGQYAHGNEPSHHVAYLYSFAGKPCKTQKTVRKIMDELYSAGPDGLCGNEDCGQMSAWYIFSALGFYPVTPGCGYYVIGSPLFSETVLNLDNGKKFKISVLNPGERNIYIKSVTLNKQAYNKGYIMHSDIIKGGEMIFEMSDKPEAWAGEPENRPVTSIDDYLVVPVPYISGGKRTFSESHNLILKNINKNVAIFYTLDSLSPGIESAKYSVPVKIKKTTSIRAVAIDTAVGIKSMSISALITEIPEGRKIKIFQDYNPSYSGGGNMALVDGIRGRLDFRSGDYQGYQGTDLTAVIDIGKTETIRKLGAGFLQDVSPWIFFPSHIEFFTSADGRKFRSCAKVTNDIPRNQWGPLKKDFTAGIKPVKARYIKVHVISSGKIPGWHPGAGNDSFFFIDEIFWNE